VDTRPSAPRLTTIDAAFEENSPQDQDSTGSDASVADHQDEPELPPMDEDEETELFLENEATNSGMYPQPFRGSESPLPRQWCWWHQVHVGSTNNHPQC